MPQIPFTAHAMPTAATAMMYCGAARRGSVAASALQNQYRPSAVNKANGMSVMETRAYSIKSVDEASMRTQSHAIRRS